MVDQTGAWRLTTLSTITSKHFNSRFRHFPTESGRATLTLVGTTPVDCSSHSSHQIMWQSRWKISKPTPAPPSARWPIHHESRLPTTHRLTIKSLQHCP